jgi:hypothetical protein
VVLEERHDQGAPILLDAPGVLQEGGQGHLALPHPRQEALAQRIGGGGRGDGRRGLGLDRVFGSGRRVLVFRRRRAG